MSILETVAWITVTAISFAAGWFSSGREDRRLREQNTDMNKKVEELLEEEMKLLEKNGALIELVDKSVKQAEEVNEINKKLFAENEELIKVNSSQRELIPKRGKWVKGTTALGTQTSTCSMCGNEVQLKTGGEIKHVVMAKGFCPICGAYNGEEDRKTQEKAD